MGIKLIQINKGQSDFYSKIPHIQTIIEIYKPDIMIINEANLNINDTISQHKFPGFILEKDQLQKTSKRLRTVILIRDNINYKRCKTLESSDNSIVWLKVKPKNSTNFYLQGTYRQWQVIKKKGTDSVKSQLERWKHQMTKWRDLSFIPLLLMVIYHLIYSKKVSKH